MTEASVALCGEGTASLALTDIPADDHAGYLRVEVEGLCEVLQIPFSFSASDTELTTIAVNPDWTSNIGESGCAMEGSAMATFAIPDSLCSDVPLVLDEGGSFGIDVEWSFFPEGSTLSFEEATATACAPEGVLTVQYMNGTPGEYAGTFILSPQEGCVQYHLPFEFTLTNPTAEPALLDPDLVPNSQGQFEVCSATSVTLGSNGSFAVNPGGIVEWIWNLNGETTSQDSPESITATLEGQGALIATLTVVDSLGCESPETSLVIPAQHRPRVLSGIPNHSRVSEHPLRCRPTTSAADSGPTRVCNNSMQGGHLSRTTPPSKAPSSWTNIQTAQPSKIATICWPSTSTWSTAIWATLDISVTCPNGTSVPLLAFPNGGGGIYFGEAGPGVGL